MTKPIIIDGVAHRKRRGRLVPIPPAWIGKVTSRQTINKRPSKLSTKARHQRKAHNKKKRALEG